MGKEEADSKGYALVTGGATRLGREFSIAAAQHGYDILLHYFSNEQGAREVANCLEGHGRSVILVRGDLSVGEGPSTVAKFIASRVSSLELLVNSASVYPEPEHVLASKGLLEESLDDWETAMALNARAPYFLIQQLVPLLSRGRSPLILNILDMSVSEPFLDRASHSISKSALKAVTTIAAKSLAPQIRVNALELGPIIPGQLMSADEAKKVQWLGIDPVLKAFDYVLNTPLENGTVVQVM